MAFVVVVVDSCGDNVLVFFLVVLCRFFFFTKLYSTVKRMEGSLLYVATVCVLSWEPDNNKTVHNVNNLQ